MQLSSYENAGEGGEEIVRGGGDWRHMELINKTYFAGSSVLLREQSEGNN